MIGFENESLRVNEIDRELPFSIATELVPSLRSRSRHQCQVTSFLEDRHSHNDDLGHLRPIGFLESSHRVEGPFELAGPEGDIH